MARLNDKNGKFGRLNAGQIKAVAMAGRIGRQIQEDFPQVAEDYRNGMYAKDMAEKYCIALRYGIFSERITINSIRFAIRGYKGDFKTESYMGLIADFSELERLSRRGILERTHEQHVEDGCKAGIKSALARGGVPWTEEEKETAYNLSQKSEYQRKSTTNNKLIAQELNRKYHNNMPIRTRSVVKANLYNRVRRKNK